MVWESPYTQIFWKAVTLKIGPALQRMVPCDIESCILIQFSRPKMKKVGNRFLDLAMALAKRQISMNWKNPRVPGMTKWEADVKVWARAEEQALRREEAKGLRRKPIALQRTTVFNAFTRTNEDTDT